MNETVIVLKDLPKHSLNEIYAGSHWSKRDKIKKQYKLIVKSQFKHVFRKDKVYKVRYCFNFKRNALDTSNTVYMLKMIEDIIFEDDTCKIIPELSVKSQKGIEDSVIITIKELKQ